MFFGLQEISSLISQYGYIAIFVLMFGESVILPIPSEVVLPLAGVLAAAGELNVFLSFGDAVVASIAGSIVGYLIGFIFGIDILWKYGKKFGLKRGEYERGINWIKRYGDYFAFFTKLLPAVRSIAGIICGAFKMDFRKFVIYATAGLVIWSAALFTLGYYFSKNWSVVSQYIQASAVYVGAVFVVAFLLYIFRKNIKHILAR